MLNVKKSSQKTLKIILFDLLFIIVVVFSLLVFLNNLKVIDNHSQTSNVSNMNDNIDSHESVKK